MTPTSNLSDMNDPNLYSQENPAENAPASFSTCFEVYTGEDVKNKESGDEYEFQKILTPQVRLLLIRDY